MPKAINGWKICSKCRERKSVSEFYRCDCRVDGYTYWCKACRQAAQRAKAAQGVLARREHPELVPTTKLCARCRERKATSEFYKNRTYSDGLDCWCSLCRRVWRGEYQEQARAQRQAYYATDVGKAAMRRDWQSDAHKQAGRRRRARKLEAEGSHTTTEFLVLCENYDFRCLCCGEIFPLERLEHDHIEPLSKGGSDDIENIQPLCRACNSHKGTRTIDYREATV